jgi:hypothetical protein
MKLLNLDGITEFFMGKAKGFLDRINRILILRTEMARQLPTELILRQTHSASLRARPAAAATEG